MKTKSPATAAKSAKPAAAKKSKPLALEVGRRKKAIARVVVRSGTGNIFVNQKAHTEYFDTEVARLEAARVFTVLPVAAHYDVEVRVSGGGLKGQAGAVSLGIARAMLALDERVKTVLRENDLITVDSRQKERKKYGQRGARRKFQFVKR